MTTSVVLMSADEAGRSLAEIRRALENAVSTFERAHVLCQAFDQAEGWRALGYRSLAACLAFELQMTRSRAYDLITKMKASVLIEEKTGEKREPGRNEARRLTAETVAAATESDQLPAPPTASAPITSSRFDDGYGAHTDTFDEGEALYECRHCGRKGTIASLSRCLNPLREAVDEWVSA